MRFKLPALPALNKRAETKIRTRQRVSLLSLSIFWLLLFISGSSKACQCPMTQLSMEECKKYEIIFKGKVVHVIDCDNKFGEALFEVQELYKGNAGEKFK